MSSLSIEAAIERLEEINRARSLGEVSVNKAVELYKEAAGLIVSCEELIKAAREEIEKTAKELGAADERL
ncbi:MAG: exodeoxyribonuclease VII small subunit [Oscillospiraceae bacterium]|nr:exodeoxyribonuclease VII small subunit [Oscillospiraceae bacterium]